MKPRSLIYPLLLAAAFFACITQPTGERKTIPAGPEEALFSEAEKQFQLKSYEAALNRYHEFLKRFPDHPFAPAALNKTGMIHAASRDFAQARTVFHQVASQYPGTPFAEVAGYELIATYYAEGRYNTVIEQASTLLKKDLSAPYRIRIQVLAGDALAMAGMPSEAFRTYAESLRSADGSAKNQIIAKLNAVLEQMPSARIKSLLEEFKDDALASGHLMFHLGVSLFNDEKYDAAAWFLSAFIERFPHHDALYEAKRLVDQINEKLVLHQNTIGCLLPLSGRFESIGNQVLKGIETALNRFSARSGAPVIKLVIKDTGSDPLEASSAVKAILDESVAAIIGPVIAAESAAIEAQDKGTPIITLSQKNNITEIGDYVFRNFITPKMQVEALVSYAVNAIGITRFAILYPDEKYGATFMELFWEEVLLQGGKVVGVEKYDPAHTDFAGPIKKLVGFPDKTPTSRAEKPGSTVNFEAIFIPDGPEKAGLILPQLVYYDVKDVFLLGTNLWHSDQLIRMARQYVQGALIPDGFFSNSTNPQVVEFVEAFQEAFEEEPGFMEAIGYDTATILLESLQRPDIRLRSQLRDHLLNLRDFKGVTGTTSFDEIGEARKILYLLKIKGNTFHEVK